MRKIIFWAVFLFFSFVIVKCNENQINPNQHVVHRSDGSSYFRTNPNNTIEDNISTNRNDSKAGIFILLFVLVIIYVLWSPNSKSNKKPVITNNAENFERGYLASDSYLLRSDKNDFIKFAIKYSLNICFTYQSSNSKFEFSRKIKPREISYHKYRKYHVIGYCLKQESDRTFDLDKMNNLEILMLDGSKLNFTEESPF